MQIIDVAYWHVRPKRIGYMNIYEHSRKQKEEKDEDILFY